MEVNAQLVRTNIHASEWVDQWRPLLARLLDLWLAARPRRLLVGIGGAPGSGKSVLAEQFHFFIERGLFHKEAHAAALPMDGFHFPNAYLNTHFRTLSDGTEIPLSSVKGQPDTIDSKSLREHIRTLIARPHDMLWPGYSRFTHDVVPDKIHIHESVNICFIEGNYLLVNRGPFQGIADVLDLRIYLDAPAPKIMANLMERHIQGGKTIEQAKDWVKRIDLPNARIAESSKANADLVLERDHQNSLSASLWKGDSPFKQPAPPPAPPPAATEPDDLPPSTEIPSHDEDSQA